MKLRYVCGLLALVLAATTAAACSAPAGGDKAGGSAGGPVVLRMANAASQPSQAPAVADFIHRVRVLSGGSVQILVINKWGSYAPNDEVQVVRAVAAGTVDLGWAGSAMFDTIGVPGLRALSAPMLIDNYRLESAVLDSSMVAPMLAGLKQVHISGLAVLGDGLRRPIAVRRPLLAPADWRGVSFGTYPSDIQEQGIRALGASPVVALGPYRVHDLATDTIQGFELDMERYAHDVPVTSARYIAANVVLWPLFDVVFANPSRLASLTAQQRAWLQQAAHEAAANSVKLVADQDNSYIRQVCAAGARFATASQADMSALRAAFAPLDRSLAADRQTGSFLRQIEELKKNAPPGPAPVIPARCLAAP